MTSIQAALVTGYFRFMRLIAPPPAQFNLEKERAGMDALSKMFKPMVEVICQPVDVSGIPGEWLTPPQVEGKRTILYLHGGYYLFGSIQSHRNLAGNIAAAACARALIIDYGLGPEHPFPAALDDARAAYHWILAHDRQPEQITLVGDSAGGGLVLSLLLSLRERGEPLPAAAVCMSPNADVTMSGESWKTNVRKDVVVSRLIAEQIQPLYLRDTDPCNPLASPLYADLHGLPPLLIQVGSHELLLSDAICLAEHARSAGVNVTLEVWPGMQHVWQYGAGFIPEARQAITRIGEFIRSDKVRNGATHDD